MRKILIVVLITLICLFLLSKQNHFKKEVNQFEFNQFDIYLDSQTGNKSQKIVHDNYEAAFKTALEKLGYQNIKVNVNFVSTSQAMYNVSKNPYSIAIVDGTKYISNQQYLDHNYKTKSLYTLTHYESDINANMLKNKTSSHDEFYFLTNSDSSFEYSTKDATEIITYIKKHNKRIALSSDEFDAAKIWFYYICNEANIDINTLNINYYNSYREELDALEQDKVDLVASTLPKYLNKNLNDSEFKYIDNDFFDVYPFSEFVIYNPTSGNFFKRNLNEIFKYIFSDGKTESQVNSAYAATNYETFNGFSSFEQTKTYNKYLNTYHNYILKEEQDDN